MLSEEIATQAHIGQKRWDGEDYINHPKRVVEILQTLFTVESDSTKKAMIDAAWLHDVLEDCDLKYNKIIKESFSTEVYDLVETLTHNSSISYNNYITKVFQHPIAWVIKWADMIDNTTKTTESQLTKYRNACILLIIHGVEIPNILKERLDL